MPQLAVQRGSRRSQAEREHLEDTVHLYDVGVLEPQLVGVSVRLVFLHIVTQSGY